MLVAALPRAVDLGHVDDDVDVVGADLVAGHVGRAGVGRDVDLGEDVEEVCLLKPTSAAQVRKHRLENAQARDELLDDLGEGLEDGVVVDAGQVEGDGRVLASVVGELILDPNRDVPLDIKLVVVTKTINLVDEDLDVDVGVARLQAEDGRVETLHGLEVVILRVDDPNKGTDLAENGLHVEGRVLKDVDLAGEVPDLEVHEGSDAGISGSELGGREGEGSVRHIVLLNSSRGFEEQGFVGGQLVEDDAADRGLARPGPCQSVSDSQRWVSVPALPHQEETRLALGRGSSSLLAGLDADIVLLLLLRRAGLGLFVKSS